jgi:hypothetical protein
MKKRWITAGMAMAMALGQATPAKAINEEWAAVAGFVGGLLVANASQGHSSTRYTHTTYYQPAPVVVHSPPPVVIHEAPPRHVVRHRPAPPPPRGYYEVQTRRVWVPGRWVYEDTGCGRPRKIWEPGYYDTIREKIWVSASRGRGCSW